MQFVFYINWSFGELNDVGGDEDCVVFRWNMWNDYICGWMFFYIC